MRTRCPACNTVFRVTSDQLRAKAGKVKCGYCQCVFNAFDQLIDDTLKVSPPVAAPAGAVEASALQRASARLADALGQAGAPDREAVVAPEPAEPEPEPEPEPQPEPAPVPGVHPGAFCSQHWQFGHTNKGTLMQCTTTAEDERFRWRAA